MAGDCRPPAPSCHLLQIPFPLLLARSGPVWWRGSCSAWTGQSPITTRAATTLLWFLVVIYRVLPTGMLQLHRQLHLGLVDLVVVAEGLEMRRQHLHAERTI